MPQEFFSWSIPAANSATRPRPQDEEEDTSVLGTIFNWVGAPGRMTAGAIRAGLKGEDVVGRALANRPASLGGTREDDFDDILADQGMEDTWKRRALGLAGDLVVDPLNLYNPIAPLVKGVKALSRASGLTDAVRGSTITKELGKAFVPHYGLEKFTAQVPGPGGVTQELSQKDLRRLHSSQLQNIGHQRGQESLEMFKGVSGDEAKDIAYALDEGRLLSDPATDALRATAAKRFNQQFDKEVAAEVMDPGARRLDYVTHLLTPEAIKDSVKVRALTGKNPFQARKELSLSQGIEAGVFKTDDVRQIMAERLTRGDRAIENQKFFDQTAKLFGKKFTGEVPKGWVKPEFAAEPHFKHSMRGIYVPQEIATDIEKLFELPKDPNMFMKAAQGITATWKAYATRGNFLGYHPRNATSNVFMTWMGGLGDTGTKVLDLPKNLWAHGRAIGYLNNPDKIGDIGKYTGDEIRDAIERYGVTNPVQSSFNEMQDLAQGTAGDLNPLSANNKFLRGGAQVGTFVENTSRLALFLDQVEKGRTVEQAALHVRKYLFDYSELTDFERSIRNTAIPFYTWARKSIPMQVDNVLNQPDKVAALADLYDSIEDTTSDRGMDVDAPEWMREYIQLPFETNEGAAVFANPNLPIQDLDKLVPSLSGMGAALNPIPKIILEAAQNKQFFTGAPIYDERLGPLADYKKANPLAQVVGLPFVDIAQENREGVQELPAAVDYAMRQIPLTSQFGKLASAVGQPEEDQNIGPIDLDTIGFLGMPVRAVTDKQARAARKQKKNDAKSRKSIARREQRRFKKSELRSPYKRDQ